MTTTYDFLKNPRHLSHTDLGLPCGVIFAHQTGCKTRKFVVH